MRPMAVGVTTCRFASAKRPSMVRSARRSTAAALRWAEDEDFWSGCCFVALVVESSFAFVENAHFLGVSPQGVSLWLSSPAAQHHTT